MPQLSLSIAVSHAVAFLVEPIAAKSHKPTIALIRAALEAALVAYYAPTWDDPAHKTLSPARCLTLSKYRPPPPPLLAACCASRFAWADWVRHLAPSAIVDLFVDPGAVSVRKAFGTPRCTIETIYTFAPVEFKFGARPATPPNASSKPSATRPTVSKNDSTSTVATNASLCKTPSSKIISRPRLSMAKRIASTNNNDSRPGSRRASTQRRMLLDAIVEDCDDAAMQKLLSVAATRAQNALNALATDKLVSSSSPTARQPQVDPPYPPGLGFTPPPPESFGEAVRARPTVSQTPMPSPAVGNVPQIRSLPRPQSFNSNNGWPITNPSRRPPMGTASSGSSSRTSSSDDVSRDSAIATPPDDETTSFDSVFAQILSAKLEAHAASLSPGKDDASHFASRSQFLFGSDPASPWYSSPVPSPTLVPAAGPGIVSTCDNRPGHYGALVEARKRLLLSQLQPSKVSSRGRSSLSGESMVWMPVL